MCPVDDPQRGEVGQRLVDGRRQPRIARHHRGTDACHDGQTAHRDRLGRAATDRERQAGGDVVDDGLHRQRHHRLLGAGRHDRSHTSVPDAGVEPVGLRRGPDRVVRDAVDGLDGASRRRRRPGGRSVPDQPGLDVEHVGEVGSEVDAERPVLRRR